MSATLVSTDRDPITFTIEGLEEVQAGLNDLADDLRSETSLAMVTDCGIAAREWMKENVRTKLWRHPTGRLENSIQAVPMTNDQGAVCYVGPLDPTIPYVNIHEFGGVIYPKRAKALSWIGDDGRRHFAKRVYIPARPYISPALQDHDEEILEICREDLDYAIAVGCASI